MTLVNSVIDNLIERDNTIYTIMLGVEPKKDYIEFSFDKDMTDEESAKIKELMIKKDEASKQYDLFSNELANKYYGLNGINTKNMEMKPKPTIKKITFSGLIGVSDLVSL